MPRREDIIGIIFWKKAKKLIPNFGRAHRTKPNKNKAVITIKRVLFGIKLFVSEPRILSTEFFVLSLFFVLKNGWNIHATNKIKVIKRIRRNIKILFLFLVTSIYLVRSIIFEKYIPPLPNNQ